MKKEEETNKLLILILGILIANLILPIGRWGENISSGLLSFARIFLTVVFLGLFIILSRYKIKKITKKKPLLVLMGILHVAVIFGIFYSIKLLNLATVGFLNGLNSVWIILFSLLFLKEKIEKKTFLAFVIAFFGLLLIFVPQIKIGSLLGFFISLATGIVIAVIYLSMKYLREDYSSTDLTFYQNAIALPFAIPLLFLARFPSFNLQNSLILLSAGIVTTLGFILVYFASKFLSGQKLGVANMLSIISPAIYGFIFFREIPDELTMLGGLLIFISILVLSLNKYKTDKNKG